MDLKLLLFRAEACEACDRQRQVFWRIRRQAPPDAMVVEVRTTQQPASPLVAQHRIQRHPTTLLLVGNREAARWEGEVEDEVLLEALRARTG